MKTNGKIPVRVTGTLDRWIITRSDDQTLAWSGARWVPHKHGVPLTNVQIPSFSNQVDASSHAIRCGFLGA